MKNKTMKMTIAMATILTLCMVSMIPISANAVTVTAIDIDGSTSPLVLTVDYDGDWVTWTFDFPVEEWTGDGNLNVGLIIALNGEGEGPAFQIHNNDGATTVEPHGTWMYGDWGPTIGDGWFGWPNHDLDVAVTTLAWVTASGLRKGQGTDGILTVSISKTELGDNFHWAASPTVGTGFFSAYDVTMQIPTDFGWSTPIVDMTVPNYIYITVPTKADILQGNGVPGKGIGNAPGLDKPIPNANFAKGTAKN